MCVDPERILLVTDIPNKCSKRVCERTLLSFFQLTFINFHVFVSGYEKDLQLLPQFESQRLEWFSLKNLRDLVQAVTYIVTNCKLIKKVRQLLFRGQQL